MVFWLTCFLFLRTGNGGKNDNCNYDMHANAPFVINVGSHTADGIPVDYSEPCSALVCFFSFLKSIFYFL